MTKKIYLTALSVFITLTSFAQQDTSKSLRRNFSSHLKISYNSSLVYPGVRVGTETLIKRIELKKINRSGEAKLIYRDRFLTTNLSFYNHPSFHANLYLTAGYTLRRTRNKGFYSEFCPEVGYSRTILGGTAYEVDNNGLVSIKKNAGYNYALASIGLGVGYDFSKSKSKPFALFYKLNILTMFPYNTKIYVRPAMELGIIYKTQKILSFNAKVINKIKSKNNEK